MPADRYDPIGQQHWRPIQRVRTEVELLGHQLLSLRPQQPATRVEPQAGPGHGAGREGRRNTAVERAQDDAVFLELVRVGQIHEAIAVGQEIGPHVSRLDLGGLGDRCRLADPLGAEAQDRPLRAGQDHAVAVPGGAVELGHGSDRPRRPSVQSDSPQLALSVEPHVATVG